MIRRGGRASPRQKAKSALLLSSFFLTCQQRRAREERALLLGRCAAPEPEGGPAREGVVRAAVKGDRQVSGHLAHDLAPLLAYPSHRQQHEQAVPWPRVLDGQARNHLDHVAGKVGRLRARRGGGGARLLRCRGVRHGGRTRAAPLLLFLCSALSLSPHPRDKQDGDEEVRRGGRGCWGEGGHK
jgi:hypothetical protein